MKTITALFGLLALPVLAHAQSGTDRPIVFGARLPGQKFSQIYRINPDGTGRLALTKPVSDATYPRWSPDGKWIVFTDGYDQAKGKKYVIDAEGKRKARRVTDAVEFDWVRDLEDQLAPGGKHSLGDNSIVELKTDKETPLEDVDLETPLLWLDSKRVLSVRCEEKDAALLEKTTLRIHSLDGKITTKFAPKPSEEDTRRFDDEASYGSAWLVHRVPLAEKFVLARLGGGNREGKWPIGLLVDTKTQRVTWWGEFGYSGIFFSPDGKRFLTCFNRKNPKTDKYENTLYIGATVSPGKLTPLVKASDLIVGDWRGGLSSQ
jgi:hypothetical protein